MFQAYSKTNVLNSKWSGICVAISILFLYTKIKYVPSICKEIIQRMYGWIQNNLGYVCVAISILFLYTIIKYVPSISKEIIQRMYGWIQNNLGYVLPFQYFFYTTQ